MQSRLRHSAKRFNEGQHKSLSSYWTHQLNFYELWKVTGSGTMTGLIKGDPMTITGIGLNAIYAVPDTNAYKTRDTDYVFHKSNGDVSTLCDGTRLITYDFAKIIVYYLDVSPYTIQYIGILDTGQSVNNKMRDDFHLSIWWSNTLSFHGDSKGNRLSSQSVWTAELTYPSILSDGHTLGFYDSTNLGSITKDPSTGEVSLWKDKLGSGNDLAQTGVGLYPIWSADGILFDGVNDILSKAFTLSPPATIYAVLKVLGYTANNIMINGYISNIYLYQFYSPRGVRGMFGNAYTGYFGLPADYCIIQMNNVGGGNDLINVNNALQTSGSFSSGTSIGGLKLGPANIQVKEVIVRNIGDTPSNATIIYNYLKAKYSL
jgi:hypothetical protein